MFIYLMMLCGIALIYYLCYKASWDEKKKKSKFLLFSGILITLILGSRWDVYGFADTWMYCENFDESRSYSLNKFLHIICKDRDTGYYSMVWYLARICPSRQWFIYFECAFLVFSVFLFIYHTTDNPLLTVFLFLGTGIFSFYMSAFRQAFAFSFCLLSYLLIEKVINGKAQGKFFRLIIGLAFFYIATTMHKSAIVFIIALLICLIKNKKIKIFAVVVSALLIVLFRDALMSSGNDVLDKEYEVEANFSMLGFFIQTVIYAVPIVLSLLTSKKVSLDKAANQEVQYYNLLAISIVGLIFYMLRLYAQSFERVAIYFTVTICSLYPVVFEKALTKKIRNELTWSVCLVCCALLLWRVMDAGAFIFFWQK